MSCKYTAGMLRDRVNLHGVVKQKDAAGGYTRQTQPFSDNPIPVIAKSMAPGRRDNRGSFDKIENRFTFVFRYREDIEASTIIEFLGDNYRITGKWPYQNRKHWLVVEAISEQE